MVSVMSGDNKPVVSAQVTVDGVTISVAGLGRAHFEHVPQGRPVSVRVSAPGYVSTAIQLDPLAGEAPAQRLATVRMMPAGYPILLEEIAAAGPVFTSVLNATVDLPANAFVDAQGQPATGAATVTISPWDVTRTSDMAAFPGNRRAQADNGSTVNLISFGMMDVHVEAANGSPLQLAPGKTAQISMDLPTDKDEQGQPLSVGDVIPLWHFDESKGLWVREGEGHVVASTSAPSGLGVIATVSHFSSWNWDRVQDQGATARQTMFRCVAAASADAPLVKGCQINVTQTLLNGAKLTNSLQALDGQVAFDALVSTAALHITAFSVDEGRRGAPVEVSVNAVGATLNIVLDEAVQRVDISGSAPLLQVPSLQLQFANLPFNSAQMGPWNYPSLKMVTFKRGSETVTVDYTGYTAVVSQDDTGAPIVLLNLGNVIPGMPGPLSADRLSGALTVNAEMSFYTITGTDQWGNSIYAPETTQVELTTSVNVPVIDKTGPLLVSVKGVSWGGNYHLWSNFPDTKAIHADDNVVLHYQAVDAFGMPTGEMGSYPLNLDEKQGFSLMWGGECGNYYADWYVLRFEIMGSNGVRSLTTQPVYISHNEPCPQ